MSKKDKLYILALLNTILICIAFTCYIVNESEEYNQQKPFLLQSNEIDTSYIIEEVTFKEQWGKDTSQVFYEIANVEAVLSSIEHTKEYIDIREENGEMQIAQIEYIVEQSKSRLDSLYVRREYLLDNQDTSSKIYKRIIEVKFKR